MNDKNQLHPELVRLLGLLPLDEKISVSYAAEVLGGGDHRVTYLMNLIADGEIVCWTHSQTDGPLTRYIDHRYGTEKHLPRITLDVDPRLVMVPSDDVLWHWCVQFEERQAAPQKPVKEQIEDRLRQTLELLQAQRTSTAVLSPAAHTPEETPPQRRARWLAEWEAEAKIQERGAYARLAARYGVDPSNMRNSILKAQEERNAQVREGAMFSQLVRSGKAPR